MNMQQTERRKYLIEYLLNESGRHAEIPQTEQDQKRLLRGLMNVRMPMPIDSEFLRIQDQYLQEELRAKKITNIDDIRPIAQDLYLWKGDITTLSCDAIVNAANSQMLGCFAPNHYCIDNAIHTFAGVQLRLECAKIMQKQGESEETGRAKITKAYNLPCKFVLHTVGPIVYGKLTKRHEDLLEKCYESCLCLADEYRLESVAFCCISTGEFCFPNERAAEIAIKTVKDYKDRTGSGIKVIFNVFKEYDYEIYKRLFRKC